MSLGTGVPASSTGQIATQLAATEPTSENPTTEAPTTEAPTTEAPATEPPTEAAVVEPTEPVLPPHVQQASVLLDSLTLEEKVWQMIFVTPDELTGVYQPTAAGDSTRRALETYPVGGIVYFKDNITGESQIRNMISSSQSYSKIPLFTCVDEEGGLVSRLSGIGVTEKKNPMATYGAAGDPQAVYDLGKEFAQQLSSVGFNLDYAPVADVLTNPNNTEIGNRAFSSDPQVVATMVTEMVKGLQEGNVISCLKHFPGHGSTSANSHYGTSVSERTLAELREEEFLSFRAGINAGAELVMISHMSLPNVTGNNEPCEFSEIVVTQLLREELGFTGLIVTDSQEMGAVGNYDSGEAALRAVLAGCDVITMPKDKVKAFEGILEAVQNGTLTEERINESVLRILSLKYEYGIIAQ
ncbi:MAG: glycoside hydrolase family 3 protein [Oscillospiraceae bacterium]|nr:glycoside hydrolase family 3 protein [Oscillospiraceae bacterium]